MTRRALCTALVLSSGMAAAGCGLFTKRPAEALDPSASETAGLGRFTTRLPPGERGPSNRRGEPARPKVSARFSGATPTNEWWTSLLWRFRDDGELSAPMFAHPLVLRAERRGLGIAYPTEPVVTARRYSFPYARDLRLSVDGLTAREARVDGASDWAVTASLVDDTRELRATFGHGLPFVYAQVSGGDAVVEVEGAPADVRVWADDGPVLGISVRGHRYGLFAPRGSTWSREGTTFRSSLARRGYVSIAVLPDDDRATLERFRRHAYAFVRDTQVTWRYDAASSRLVSRFSTTTDVMERGPNLAEVPLLALYPHQWKHSRAELLGPTYVSPRGPMKLTAGAAFETELTVHGILPLLPKAPTVDRDVLASYLAEGAAGELFPPGPEGKKDSYWAGKSLGRVASLAWIADQLGDRDRRNELVRALEHELEDWFDGRPPNLFYYDATWSTLVGFPSGYQSATELNDHHFHYGYFLWAAATVAAFDPQWAQAERWGAMVRLLAKDAANWDPKDTRFPRLRNFDPYAGHSWANGPALFESGNNEESSSEDANFAAGLALFGALTGDDTVRDTGLFLYETVVSAISAYWFDVEGDVFPKSFSHPVAAIVWGDGAAYDTWWDRNPVYVHGINVLPVTAASLYLGRNPAVVQRSYDHLLVQNRGAVHQWRDILWMYLALANPDEAHRLFSRDHSFEPEQGSSWAFVYHFIESLRGLGSVDPSVTASSPFYAVLRRGTTRTYAAYNPSINAESVRFSDGTVLDVRPRSLASTSRPVPRAPEERR